MLQTTQNDVTKTGAGGRGREEGGGRTKVGVCSARSNENMSRLRRSQWAPSEVQASEAIEK